MYNGYSADNNNWWSEDWSQGNGMNVMMLLETGNACEGSEKKANEKVNKTDSKTTVLKTKIAGERDPVKGTRRDEPIRLCNKYIALQDDDEDMDEQTEVETSATDSEDMEYRVKHKPNKRQRQRRKEMHNNNNTIHIEQVVQALPPWRRGKALHNNDEDVKDVPLEMDWLELETTTTTQPRQRPQTTHRHSTDYIRHIRQQGRRRHNTCECDNDDDVSPSKMSTSTNHNAGTYSIGNTCYNNSTTTQSYNHWLKPGDHAGKSNCLGPQSSRGSHVNCQLVKHWQPAQCQCAHVANWSCSSGLLVGFASNCALTSSPHEWTSDGADGREVMSPAQGAPLTELHGVPKPMCPTAQGTCFLNTHTSVPGQLVWRKARTPMVSGRGLGWQLWE